jgi:hypothetical protein
LQRKSAPLIFWAAVPQDERTMDRSSLQALRNMISEVELLISTTTRLPEERSDRCLELLKAALAVTDDLLKESSKKWKFHGIMVLCLDAQAWP